MNKFIIPVVDTDSVMICKPDQSPFTEEEINNLTVELNSMFPNGIRWDLEDVYKRVIVSKAKNYILYDGKKITLKGSAFKSSTKEIALKEFCNQIIDCILKDNNNFVDIYNKYIYDIIDMKDIKKWSSKKTISKTVLTSPRTNEKKIRDAIEGREYQEGDKMYFFFKSDNTLCLVDEFDGDYNNLLLLKKLYNATKIFDTILPTKELFINYSLKKNQKALQELCNARLDNLNSQIKG